MSKILFIVPPAVSFDDFITPSDNVRVVKKGTGSYGNVYTDMPLGVLSLSAYVKKYAGAETRLVDFNVLLNKLSGFGFSSFADFFRRSVLEKNLPDYSPDIIAISALFTPAYRSVLDIARICREISPGSVIIAGGAVPTNMYKEMFGESDAFDALCFGEGEKPLLGLLKAGDKMRYFKENSSWITPQKAFNGQLFRHDFIENLDEIPFFDYSILNPDDYGLNPAITAYAAVEGKKQNFHVMTSRGCPFRCCFCSSHTVHGRKVRYHSLNRVKDDLTRLKDCYKAKTIVFQDDHLLANKKRALEIINVIKELRMTPVFQNGLTMYALDRKMLENLKDVDVNHIVLPVESGSGRVLREIIHKPLNLSVVKRVVDDCRELGIYTTVNILIGFPGETKSDIEESRLFLRTINANWFIILVATPLVGSEMFGICLEKNYLKGDYIDCSFKSGIIETEDFDVEYIHEKEYALNLELNFVENSDLRLGDYKTALKGFENAIKAKNDHAFGYYYAARCYEEFGEREKALQYIRTAKKIVSESLFWRKYADKFNVPL
ncbi:MAG: B12-binding domain-containing radical SAM protein [Elusimicrobia bacterium CG08_land_8_20_14_0_20_51_18]|nr:MAG: B12-binding domain-containing radical SAM protein [Elusimicrobia bacterium CG08_land_8_20_14_0_20_51_18]